MKFFLKYCRTNNHLAFLTGILISIPIFLLNCSSSFDPLQENNQYHFSIYGYLDASADTQWVRVMPVRDSLILKPRPIDATVKLEHMETGRSVTLNDSLFRYAHDRYAWNFWNTEKLRPGENYRLTARRSDGKSSHATVQLPADFPTPIVYVRGIESGTPDLIEITGIDKLADAKVTYLVEEETSTLTEDVEITISHLQDTSRTNTGRYQIYVDQKQDLEILQDRLGNNVRVPDENKMIEVTAANSQYLNFSAIDDKIIALPEGISNVDEGVGYLTGIISKRIPYKSCYDENGDRIPCSLLK